MADIPGLFDPSLISREVATSFPGSFVIRPLAKSDYRKGYLDCLRVLTWVGDLTEDHFNERYDDMVQAKGTYYLLVIEHNNCIVGTGSLVVEKKFIHNRGICGHIEEVAIAKEFHGKGLGLKMIKALDSVAVNVGCYKCILNCSAETEPFYVKGSYFNSGTEMSHYFEEEKPSYYRG